MALTAQLLYAHVAMKPSRFLSPTPSPLPRRYNSSPPGYNDKGKKPPTEDTPVPNYPDPQSTTDPGAGQPFDSDRADWDPDEDWDNWSGEIAREGRIKGDSYPQSRSESTWPRDEGGEGAVYGALGQAEEEPTHELPKNWNTLVSTLCLRTNFEPAELADLYQRFRQLAGMWFYEEEEGMYQTESEMAGVERLDVFFTTGIANPAVRKGLRIWTFLTHPRAG